MSAKTNTAKIGLFVILAIVILVAGMLAFGAKTWFTKKDRFETAIPGQVYGLSDGSRVELRGVPIGKVTQIAFAWNKYPNSKSRVVVVEFEVEAPLLPLPKGMTMKTALHDSVANGLRARIKSQGITGTSLLALELLDPEQNPPPPIDYTPRHYYVPSAPSQITRMLESVEKSLTSFQQIDFGVINQNVTNTFGGVQQLLGKFNNLDLELTISNANTLLTDLRATSAKATTLLADVQTNLAAMKLQSLGQNADKLLVSLHETSARAQTTLEKLGTAPVGETLADLQQLLNTLEAVLVELKQYPSGFLFGQPPRPIKGVETQ